MQELWITSKEWFWGLGAKYGVDPVIFGAIYIGAIPFFMLSAAWLVANFRKKKPIALPAFSTGFFFISSYLYLFIAGENIPLWVYAFATFVICSGAYSSVKSIKGKLGDSD